MGEELAEYLEKQRLEQEQKQLESAKAVEDEDEEPSDEDIEEIDVSMTDFAGSQVKRRRARLTAIYPM